MGKYSGKLIWVTGGSEGIGKEVGKEFVKAGAHVVISSRSSDKLALALKELEALRVSPQQKIESKVLDVTLYNQTVSVADSIVSKMGVPDYVINCAGYARPGYIHELDIEHYKKMMDLNYFGIVHVCKAIVPHLLQAKKGHIVNTSSMAGFIGLFGYTGYCGSKYAVVGFSEGLRRELENVNIRVSVLCPPNTRTPGFVEENKFKPAEVLKTEEKAKSVDPDFVAKELLRELPKNKFFIVPTFDGKMALSLSRWAPGILSTFVKRPQIN